MMIMTEVAELLPQREPYILIDHITDVSADGATTLYKIKEESPFVQDGKMQAAGVIENVAQTCAAHIGYYNRHNIRIGVIGAVPTMQITRLPRVGEIVETTVTFTASAFNISQAEAVVCCASSPIAKGTLKISLT